MESFEELKKHLTDYLDERIEVAVKAGVDEANKAVRQDIADLNEQVMKLPDLLSDLLRNDINAVQQGITGIINTINNINPFKNII